MKKFILTFFIICINSNIWDNIYSQIYSPQTPIPENFQIILINENDNSTAGELLISSELKLIKFTFLLDDSNNVDPFIHLLIDFNKGRVYFDSEEKCVFHYSEIFEKINPLFIIRSYDLLSYFSEDEENYHYIVINPLELTEFDESLISKLPPFLKKVIHELERIILKVNSIYDKRFYGDFVIDKKEGIIKSISIKIFSTFSKFNTKYSAYNIEKEKFKSIHNLEDCIEYQE